MTIRNLEGFFAPNSLALIGPCRHPDRVVQTLATRITESRPRFPVNLVQLESLQQEQTQHYTSIEALPDGQADLAIWLGEAEQTPSLVQSLAHKGTRALLFPSPGYENWPDALLEACQSAANEAGIRLIGPGSLGFAIPHLNLSPLLGAAPAAPGDIAFIARSGAVLNATLSWANTHNTGFSAIVSLGARSNVTVGNLIDYFDQDYRTRAIAVHLEHVSNPRQFLSAARAAARNKPVIVIRSGNNRDNTEQIFTHAGKRANTGLIHEAAFRRAGMLQVSDLDGMFKAVETLSRVRLPRLKTLPLISNSRSLISLATEHLQQICDDPTAFSDQTLEALSPFLAPQRGLDNPSRQAKVPTLILKDSLSCDELRQALNHVMMDPATDAALVMMAPTAFNTLSELGAAIAQASAQNKRKFGRRKAIIACLAGANHEARTALDAEKVPCYSSPSEVVQAITYLAEDTKARDFLMTAPPSLPEVFTPDTQAARQIVMQALADKCASLSPDQVSAVLAAYQIPMIPTRTCATAKEAAKASGEFFGTYRCCVVKLLSPDLPFRSHINGIRFDLASPREVSDAANDLLVQAKDTYPEARISGVCLQPMIEDRYGLELFAGLANTPVFGPIVVFGHGGPSGEALSDTAVELPPLNLHLADSLIGRTRISRLITGSKTRPPLDQKALSLTLVKLSQIAVDIPEIAELDINPLVLRETGFAVLDARINLCEVPESKGRGNARLAICPYPKEWEEHRELKDGRKIFIRPVRPEDEELFLTFFQSVTQEDLRLRFFAPVKEFTHRFLAGLTQLDYARSMAFAALCKESGELLGVVRLHADPDHRSGEYAVMVRSDLKGAGLGWLLMKRIIRYAHADGIETINGEVLKENTSMLAMCEALGFHIATSQDDPGIAHVTLNTYTLDKTVTK